AEVAKYDSTGHGAVALRRRVRRTRSRRAGARTRDRRPGRIAQARGCPCLLRGELQGGNLGMNSLSPGRFFHRLRHARVENKGLKALSLLLAVLLFIVSRQPIIELLLISLPIEYHGLSPSSKR